MTAPERIPHMMEKDLHQAVYGDPLRQLQDREKELIRRYCLRCTEMPEALPKYMQCVDWAEQDEVATAHLLLERWHTPTKEVGGVGGQGTGVVSSCSWCSERL